MDLSLLNMVLISLLNASYTTRKRSIDWFLFYYTLKRHSLYLVANNNFTLLSLWKGVLLTLSEMETYSELRHVFHV